MITLIANTTGATQSDPVSVPDGVNVIVQLTGTWAAAEYADIQYFSGGSWADLYEDGVQIRLSTASVTALRISGPFKFRIDKDASASAAGVELHHSTNANVYIG